MAPRVILGVELPEPMTMTPKSWLVLSVQFLEPVGLSVIVAGKSLFVKAPALEAIVRLPLIFKVGSQVA